MLRGIVNAYYWERAQDTDEERLVMGGFRCFRCEMVKPLPWTEQDGNRLCRRCTDAMSPVQAQLNIADSVARSGQKPVTPLEQPPTAAFVGAPVVTAITPSSVNLTRGGSAQTVNIAGQNLSASDTYTSNDAGIVITPTVNSTTSVTLSVTAGGGDTPGDYNLSFNGDVMTPRGIFKVR